MKTIRQNSTFLRKTSVPYVNIFYIIYVQKVLHNMQTYDTILLCFEKPPNASVAVVYQLVLLLLVTMLTVYATRHQKGGDGKWRSSS